MIGNNIFGLQMIFLKSKWGLMVLLLKDRLLNGFMAKWLWVCICYKMGIQYLNKLMREIIKRYHNEAK